MQANIIYQVYDSQRRIERREQRERDRRLSLLAATMRRRWRPIVAVRSGGWAARITKGLKSPLKFVRTLKPSARQDSEKDQGGH
jgi:hypothetical protein